MNARAAARIRVPSGVLPAITAGAALGIFVTDALTPPDCVVSGLYVLVVLMASRFLRGRSLLLVCVGCCGLAIFAQVVSHGLSPSREQERWIGVFNALASIVAVALSGLIVLRGQAAEAALMRAQTDLARISRMTTMGELTASIAHEVNQPIAAVVTNAGACIRWLAAEPPDLDQARAAAGRIVRDGTRAASVVRHIRLLFTKEEAPRERIDLNQVARETIGLLAAEAHRFGVAIRVDLHPHTPWIVGDRVQLQQVLMNLMVNGLEAMKTTDGPRWLTVTAGPQGGEALMTVADTGVGLPAGEAERLFDPFFTTKPEGTGMGLAISRSIVEAHQGRLSAQANAPGGAVFLLALPAGEAAPQA
jgi:C4-dicarboxylate-specific signal transduction histidine kinase